MLITPETRRGSFCASARESTPPRLWPISTGRSSFWVRIRPFSESSACFIRSPETAGRPSNPARVTT